MRKKIVPINLDELFNEVSHVRSSSLSKYDDSPLKLTPRSHEACIKLGVNPEFLKIRELDSFWEADIDSDVIRIRHEAYVQRRHDLMKKCSKERKKNILNDSLSNSAVNPYGNRSVVEKLIEQEEIKNSELLRQETIKLKKIKDRQEKEMRNMLKVIRLLYL